MATKGGPNIVKDGLVLKLDAGNKKSYPTSGTTWTDISGNGNNGTLTNGPTFDSENNGSLVFDGVNDYVTLPNVGVSNLSAFSVSFWAKKSNPSNNVTVYSEGTPSSWPSNLFIIYFGGSENSGACRVWYGHPTISSPLIGETNVVNGNWYYVTYNQTNTSNRSLYVNTIVEATNTNTINSSSTNTYIGANNNKGNMTQFGDFTLSNLHSYNRALSTEEILQNYNATKGRFGL